MTNGLHLFFWQLWTLVDIESQSTNKTVLKPQQNWHQCEFHSALSLSLSLTVGANFGQQGVKLHHQVLTYSRLLACRNQDLEQYSSSSFRNKHSYSASSACERKQNAGFQILLNLSSNSLTMKKKILTNSQQLIKYTQDVQSGLNILGVLDKNTQNTY